MNTILRAGPLQLVYGNGEVRSLTLESSGIEVVRRIYGAVRDRNWGTVPLRITNEKIEDGGDHFHVSFDALHTQASHGLRGNSRNDIEFQWHGEIRGGANGTVVFSFDGRAKTTFERNRIGFCVLHPIRECAGVAARVEQNGSIENARFPRQIAPHEPFQDITALCHQVAPDLWARLAFEGEVFETEDQRNWIDASFKTFSTPLSLPCPVTVEAGTHVWQSVTLDFLGSVPSQAGPHNSPILNRDPRKQAVRVAVEAESATRLAPIGLCVATVDAPSQGQPLMPREIEALRMLHLNHLRVDLTLHSDYQAALRQAAGGGRSESAELRFGNRGFSGP